MSNGLTISYVGNVPTYTFSGSSCTFDHPPDATFDISITGNDTNLSINPNNNTQDNTYAQTGSLTFDTAANPQSIIYAPGIYTITNFTTGSGTNRSIVLSNECQVTVANCSGNAKYYIGNESTLVLSTTITGSGVIYVGSSASSVAENNAKLLVSAPSCSYSVFIVGNNCELDISNATITVQGACVGAIIRGNSNTITINSGAMQTKIIGDTNTVTNNGKNTQQISSAGTELQSGTFGNVTISGNTISNGTAALTITGTSGVTLSGGTTSVSTLSASANVTATGNVSGVNGTFSGTLSGAATTVTTLSSTSTTNATSNTTGALVVSGGAGIAQDLYVGGNIILASLATVDGIDVSVLGGTVNNLNTTLGLGSLTTSEVSQLANINATTISSATWGFLGGINQGLSTTGTPSFTQVTAGNVRATANTISAVTGNLTLSAGEILLSGDPVSALGAATKQYVDNIAQGLDYKASCIVIATSLPAYTASGAGVGKTITASSVGALTIDSVAMVVGYRVLVSIGTIADNGIYTVTSAGSAGSTWVLTRSTDADSSAKVTSGLLTFIENGTTGSGKSYILITNGTIVLDTTALSFTQFSGAGVGNTYTMSNVGTGVGVYSSTSANNFNMRNILATAPMTATLSTNDIVIAITQSGITHNNLGGLTTGDPHTQYCLLAGRSTGQVLTGGTAASEVLTLRSTSNVTKGQVYVDETTASSSTSTGAFRVGGGVGIAGNVFAGGNLNGVNGVFSGTMSVTGAATLGSIKSNTINTVLTSDAMTITGGASLTIAGGSSTGNSLTLKGNTADLTGSVTIASTTASTTTGTGALIVAGGAGIAGAMFLGGALTGTAMSGTTVTASTSLTTPTIIGVTNALTIEANGAGTGTITIPSITNFTNTTTSSATNNGAVTVTGGIGVGGNSFFGGTLNVSGATTLGTVTTGAATVQSIAASGTNLAITGGSGTSGMTMTGSTAASGTLTLVSTSNVTKPTAGVLISDNIASTSTSTGALVVTGGAAVGGAFYATSLNTGTGNITTVNATTVSSSGTLTVTGTTGITVSSATTFSSTIQANSTITGSSSIIAPTLAGSSTTLGNLTLKANTADSTGTITVPCLFTVSNNTASTTTSSGALTVTGGVGIGGSVFIGGNLNVSGTLTVSSAVSFGTVNASTVTTTGANLAITGGSGTSGMTITGSTAALGTLTLVSTSSATKPTAGVLVTDNIASSSNSTGALVVTGGLGVGGALYANTMNTGTAVLGGVTLNSNTLTVTGTMTLTSTTGITTASTISCTNVGASSLSLAGGAAITGNVTANNVIAQVLAGSSSAAGNLILRANTVDTTGLITIPSPTTISNSTASTTTGTGALIVSGGVGIGGNTFIGGNGSVTGTMAIAGVTTFTSNTASSSTGTGTIVVTGGIGASGNVYAASFYAGTIDINGTNAGVITSTGSLGISSAINTNITLTTTGTGIVTTAAPITTTNATAASSTSTGALIVSGGVGVAGKVYAGSFYAGTIDINGTTAGSITGTGAITVTTGTNTNLVLSPTGTGVTTTSRPLTITNSTASTTTATGAVIITGGLGVGGAITAGSLNVTSFSGTTLTASTSLTTPLVTNTGTLTLTGTSGVTTANPLTVTNATASTSTSTGALIVTGGIGVGGALYVGSLNMSGTTLASSSTLAVTSTATTFSGTTSATVVSATSNTASTSSTTGALIVTGGMAAGANSTFATNVSIGGTTPIYAGGVGVLYMNNVTTEPSTAVSAGCISYAVDQRLMTYNGSFTINASSEVTVRVKTVTGLAANTANGTTITANANGALATIDGVTMVINDYVFVDSSSGVTNTTYGIYKITSLGSGASTWSMTRALVANTPAKFSRGTIIIVSDGATAGGSIWIHTTNASTGATFTFATVLTFSQVASSTNVTAATNLGTGVGVYSSIASNTLRLNSIAAGTGINVALNTNNITITTNDTAINHNALANNAVGDVHTQYVLSAGRSGGQTFYGGTGSGENLTIQSNSNSAGTGAVIIPSTIQVNSGAILGTSGSSMTVTGGNVSGNNLILRSTSAATKGSVTVDETTISTSTTTGALVVAGGMGADTVSTKNIYIGTGTATYSSGVGVIELDDVNTEPSSINANGNYLYSIEQTMIANYHVMDISHICVNVKTIAALPANTANGTTITRTGNGALPTIDGMTMSIGSYILVDYLSGVTPTTAHGIYRVTDLGSAGTPWILTRSALANTSAKLARGLKIFVTDGLTESIEEYVMANGANDGTTFVLNTDTPIIYKRRGYYNNVTAASTSTSTATVWTSVHNTLTTPTLPAGQYVVSWSFEYSHTATNVTFYHRIFVDGATSLTNGTTGLMCPRPAVANVRQLISGFSTITFATVATHTIALQFNAGSGTSTIANSTIRIQQV